MRLISVPFRIGPKGGIAVTSDLDQIARQQILDVLTTNRFERPMRPYHGAQLDAVVFDVADPTSLADEGMRAKEKLRRSVTIGRIDTVRFRPHASVEGAIEVIVTYVLPPYQDTREVRATLRGLITQETPF